MDLSALQQQVVATLSGHEYFSAAKAIPVLSEDLGDIQQRLQAAVARLGVFVLVSTPFGRCELQEETPPALRARVVCTVVEAVTINRGRGGIGETVGRVASAVAALLHLNPDCGMLVLDAITLSSAYLPQIARDVSFFAPVTTVAMPARPTLEVSRLTTEGGDLLTTEDGTGLTT